MLLNLCSEVVFEPNRIETFSWRSVVIGLSCKTRSRKYYKYWGYVVHLFRDVGKVYRELPLLPKDLDTPPARDREDCADEPPVSAALSRWQTSG